MYRQFGAEKQTDEVRSGCSQKVAGNIDDDDYPGCQFQVKVLLQADEKNHCHREHSEKQFIPDSGLPTQDGHGGVQKREYMYNA